MKEQKVSERAMLDQSLLILYAVMYSHFDLVMFMMGLSYPQNGCCSSWDMRIIIEVFLITPLLKNPLDFSF